MGALFKTLLLFSIIFQGKLLSGGGTRVEMYVYSYIDLQDIINYLERWENVTLHFYEPELEEEGFTINISPLQLAPPTASVVVSNLNTEVCRDFLVSGLTNLIDLLKENGWSVNLQLIKTKFKPMTLSPAPL